MSHYHGKKIPNSGITSETTSQEIRSHRKNIPENRPKVLPSSFDLKQKGLSSHVIDVTWSVRQCQLVRRDFASRNRPISTFGRGRPLGQALKSISSSWKIAAASHSVKELHKRKISLQCSLTSVLSILSTDSRTGSS
jgi:hypothetical protein